MAVAIDVNVFHASALLLSVVVFSEVIRRCEQRRRELSFRIQAALAAYMNT